MHKSVCVLLSLHRRGFSSSKTKKTRVIGLPDHVRAKELAKTLRKCTPNRVIKEICIQHAKRLHMKHASKWYRFSSAKEVIIPFSIASEYATGRDPSVEPQRTTMLDPDLLAMHIKDGPSEERQRRVVAFLGHFNHGKTSVLDALGETSFVNEEDHGITQNIRVQTVRLSRRNTPVTLVDTPGQHIFFRMRNYGALVADAVVLVVAADAGLDLQTQESIGIIQELDLPVICCVNKVDLIEGDEEAMQKRVRAIADELHSYEGLADVPVVATSATQCTGLGDLKDALAKMAMVLDDMEGSRLRGTRNVGGRDDDGTASGDELHAGVPVWTSNRPGIGGAAAVPLGMGIVADAWSSPVDGHSLLIVVRRGSVRPGDAYSSGGWAGTVRALLPDGNRHDRVQLAHRGTGLTALVSVTFAGDPRPLGEPVFFFKTTNEAVRYAEQWHMRFALKNYEMDPVEDFPTIRYLEEVRGGEKKGSKVGVSTKTAERERQEQQEVARGDAPVVEIGVQENSDASFDVDENAPFPGTAESDGPTPAPRHVVLKADTEMAIGTLVDSIETSALGYVTLASDDDDGGCRDSCEANSTGECELYGERHTGHHRMELVKTGVGNVRLSDVRVAHAADADIYLYRVKCDPRALKQAKQLNLRLHYFDKLEDLLATLQLNV